MDNTVAMGKMDKFLVLLFFWMNLAGSYALGHEISIIPVNTSNVIDNEKLIVNHSEYGEEKQGYRLPRNVTPVGYRLNITTQVGMPEGNLDEFQGRVEIDVIVEEQTDAIYLHSRNLTISEFHISEFDQRERLDSVTIDKDPLRNFLIFQRRNLGFEAATYTITIEYAGLFRNGSTVGFFKNSYTNDDGKQVWYAMTDFEPIDARAAFPCFDEPGFKTRFNISITHYKGYSATSNTPKIITTTPNDDGMVTTSFEETPKMSTYLVAFLVSNFESMSNAQGNLKILARPNAIKDASFALQTEIQILEKLDDYTKLPYSRYMKKLDQVAVKQVGSEGTSAMENWGLVIYREEHLLVHESTSQSARREQDIAETISHEFAHQWFGNLISPKWWKYLWLSEGMSTLFQYFILEKVKPEWRSIEKFSVEVVLLGAFNSDSPTGLPLNNDVKTSEEIESLFTHITYSKGAAILRMMQHFMTEPVFQRGLQNYINEEKETSVDSDDFFQLIDEVASRENPSMAAQRPGNLTEIMDVWVNRAGYPLITVTRNYTDNTVYFEQECFIASHMNTSVNCTNTWNVPINYATTGDTNFNNTAAQFWLIETFKEQAVNVKPEQWIILNKQVTGYYRVNYDEKNWLLIIEHLKTSRESIRAVNRAQLYSDALALVKAGRLNYTIVLGLASALKRETNHNVWAVAVELLLWLRNELLYTQYYPSFEEYFRMLNGSIDHQLIKSVELARGISWSSAFHDSEISFTLVYELCSHDLNMRNLFRGVADENYYTPRVKPFVPCCNYRNATDNEFNEIYNSISNEDIASTNGEPMKMLCLRNQWMLQSYLNLTNKNEELDFSTKGTEQITNFLGSTATTRAQLEK
ncbi:hypothetical protein QAD02_006067, partial [Eretmocerus hayati]